MWKILDLTCSCFSYKILSVVSQAFGEDFVEDKLKPFYKSDPIPETVSFKLYFLVINFPSYLSDASSFHAWIGTE